MPLVRRSVADMIGHFSNHTDILVNPTNLTGLMNSGLAKAFAERWPAMAEDYREYCASGKLDLGSLHIYRDPESKNTIINLPTKRDWRDIADIADIEAGCVKLAVYLQQHPFHTVAMPLLGGGTQRHDPADVPAILTRHLEPLPNIIHLSIRPDRFIEIPRYLVVVGSRAYNDFERIRLGVMDGLIDFGLSYKDFEAMVSGGAAGVDRAACGTGRADDDHPTLARENGVRAVVCRADWDRYGDSAGYVRNRTVFDIGTHFVAFVGSRSRGTKNTIRLIETHNETVDQLSRAAPAVDPSAVFDGPAPVIPEKKKLHICDISNLSV